MKCIDLLIIGLLFSPLSYAEPTWYCESGDPSGGGPQATAERIDSIEFQIDVSYNQSNMDSPNRSSTLSFAGAPISTDQVSEEGMTCIRHSFIGPRDSRTIQLFHCEDAGVSFIKLIDFSLSAPEYELSCQ